MGSRRKKVKGLAKEHIYMTPGHRQWCNDSLRGGGGDWVEVGKRRKSEENYNSVNKK